MMLAEGMRVCMVALCDTKFHMPALSTQRQYWQWLYTAVGDYPHWLWVLANQPGHATQTIGEGDLAQFEPPPSIAGFPPALAALFNPHGDETPFTLPGWAFSAFCSKREDPNWWAEIGFSLATAVQLGANGRPGTHQATVLFEPPPSGRVDHPEWTSADKRRQMARMIAPKGIIGANHYSVNAADSLLYDESSPEWASLIEFIANLPNP
jgi:hypothetical protein